LRMGTGSRETAKEKNAGKVQKKREKRKPRTSQESQVGEYRGTVLRKSEGWRVKGQKKKKEK